MPDQNKRQAVDSGIKQKPCCWCHNKTKERLLVYWTKIRTLPCLVHPSKISAGCPLCQLLSKLLKMIHGFFWVVIYGFQNWYRMKSLLFYKWIVVLHLRKWGNVNNGWLKKEDNYTLKQKRRITWHLSTGYEDKKYWFIWFCNNLMWIEKKPHKQFQRTLPVGISQSNSKSMYHITRVFVRQKRYMLNQQTS